MPSLTARAISFVLRTTGYYKKLFAGGPDLEEKLRALRAQPVAAPTEKMRRKVSIGNVEFEGRTCWQISPKQGVTSARMLYFHGGGYVYSASPAHFDFLAHMAEKHGISSIVPMYPLAPEADAKEYTAFALSLYRFLLSKHDAKDIVIAGDSAGGGMAVTTARLAQEAGMNAPAGLVLICPWLDATASAPEQPAIEKRDAILTIRGIRDIGPLLARGLPVTDPLVSPINADIVSLPPTLMYGGGDDILVTDARAFKAKFPAIDYREGAGLIHVWPVFIFPESRTAQGEIAGFVKRVCGV